MTCYFRYPKTIMKKLKKALLIQLSGDSETPCIAKLLNGATGIELKTSLNQDSSPHKQQYVPVL